ncbi:MAG: histidine phosphatase family protein [Caulobacteraceae bacterium]
MTVVVMMVRHGSHDRLGKVLCGRMPGVELSAQGHAEAEALGRRLAGQRLAAVYASPLERAAQTAAPIAAAHDLSVTTDADLMELDVGAWTGETFEALHADPAWAVWNRARGVARTPGGESMLDGQVRASAFLYRMLDRHAGGVVAAVSHGDVIKAALALVMGLSLDQHDRFEISPASVSTIVMGDWGAKIHSLNEAPL